MATTTRTGLGDAVLREEPAAGGKSFEAPLTHGPCRSQLHRDREPPAGPRPAAGWEWGFHGDRGSVWEDGPSWRGRWWRLHSSVTVPDATGLCPEQGWRWSLLHCYVCFITIKNKFKK